jgi:hypothetical protein
VGKNYKRIFRDIYLTSNYSIKSLRIISFLLFVLTSLRYRIQTNRRKQDTKELAKNLLNFLLVMIQTIFSFDIIYFILIFTQAIVFSNTFPFLYQYLLSCYYD